MGCRTEVHGIQAASWVVQARAGGSGGCFASIQNDRACCPWGCLLARGNARGKIQVVTANTLPDSRHEERSRSFGYKPSAGVVWVSPAFQMGEAVFGRVNPRTWLQPVWATTKNSG